MPENTPSQSDRSPDDLGLDDEDEAALDAAWDKIAEEDSMTKRVQESFDRADSS